MMSHTPSIAFWYRPPDSARIGYATEGAFFIILTIFTSAQLSTGIVSSLQKDKALIRLWKQHSIQTRMSAWGASAPILKRNSSVSVQTILVLFVLALAAWADTKEIPDIIWVVSWFGPAVRCYAGKQKGLSLIPLWLPLLFKLKRLWFVDTVLWLCPSQLMKH